MKTTNWNKILFYLIYKYIYIINIITGLYGDNTKKMAPEIDELMALLEEEDVGVLDGVCFIT